VHCLRPGCFKGWIYWRNSGLAGELVQPAYLDKKGQRDCWHARVFMARNSYQVLGPDLATPVDFVWCWTPHGAVIGGTGQALRIAAAYEIPVFNLATDKDYSGLETWLAAAGFDLSELPTA